MAITLRSVSYTNAGAVNGTNGDFSVTKPASLAASDVILAEFLIYSGGGVTHDFDTIPSGWTSITNAAGTITSGSDIERLRRFWYRATGSDPASWTWSLDAVGCFVQYQLGTYIGCHTSLGPVDVAGQQSQSTSSATAPTVTVTYANSKLVFISNNLNGRTYTPPASSGWTERHEDVASNNYWADKDIGAGATGAITFTMNSADTNNGCLIALIDAGAGGGGGFTALARRSLGQFGTRAGRRLAGGFNFAARPSGLVVASRRLFLPAHAPALAAA